MVNSISGFGEQNQQIRQNPDEYARVYAQQNGISFEEAKAELREKYGDPQEQNSLFPSGSFGNSNNYNVQDISNILEDLQNLEEELSSKQNNNQFLSYIMNFLQGNNYQDSDVNNSINPATGTITGPQKEGDPQFHLNPSTGTQTGPQKEGDPQFHINPNTGTETGPQQEGDFNFFNNNNSQDSQMNIGKELNPFFM